MSESNSKKLLRGLAALVCSAILLTPFSGASAATVEYTVTASRVNIRKKATTSSDILTVVRQGQTLTLVSSSGDGWLKVNTAKGEGYLSEEYVCLTALTGTGATATVLAEKLNIRSDTSTSSRIIAVVRQNTSLDVLALTDGWLQVSYNGQTGYVSPEFVALTPGAESTATPTLKPTATPAPLPTATAQPDMDSTVLRKGSTGAAVVALQQKLIILGYLTGYADGVFGNDTVSAVKAFQRDAGLAADGTAGTSTLAALTIATATPTPKPTATATPAPTYTRTLKKGDKGDAVMALQEKLIALGYLSGKADGIFGSDTRDAIKAFQRNEGMDDDGVAGPSTLAALNAVVIAPSDPSQPENSAPITGTLLKKGSRGDDVKALQQKLIALGYLTGTADGYYGDQTVSAVKTFQLDKDLTVDGVAGTSTLAALNAASGNSSPSNPTGASLLKYGDKGDAVMALQTRLKELGYFNGSIGGNFGSLTRDAVKAFQTAAGLTADGMAGEDTLNALYAADAPSNNATTLRIGDSGDAVIEMQTRLKTLGYLTGSIDGDFGTTTQAAVMAFQTAAGLTSDGIAGPTTLNALFSDNAPAAPVPSVPGEDDTSGLSPVANKIIETAKKYLGCKYVYACEDPPYFDCSGLTQYVFKQYGYSLLRTAYQQGYNDKYQKLTMSQLKTGDLVFFNTNLTDGDLCDHTGIYIGNGDFIHASSSAAKVIISNLNTGYYSQRFSWGRRILE